MAGPANEAEVTRADRSIKTSVDSLRQTDHRLHRQYRRPLQDLAAGLLPTLHHKTNCCSALFDRNHGPARSSPPKSPPHGWPPPSWTGQHRRLKLVLIGRRATESTTQTLIALSLYHQHLAERAPTNTPECFPPLHQRSATSVARHHEVSHPTRIRGRGCGSSCKRCGPLRSWAGHYLNGTPIDAANVRLLHRARGIRDRDDESVAPTLAELFRKQKKSKRNGPATRDGDFAMTRPVSPNVVKYRRARYSALDRTA